MALRIVLTALFALAAAPAAAAEKTSLQLGFDAADAGNDALAAQHYRSACDTGTMQGCVLLGTLHANGRGVPKDETLAVTLYRQGCDGGSAIGCANLAFAYSSGKGVQRDDAQAVALFQLACDKRSTVGCLNLATMYDQGIGVPKDPKKAIAAYLLVLGLKPNEDQKARAQDRLDVLLAAQQ